MAIRTTSDDVLALMLPGKDYDPASPPNLTGFIASASALVDRVSSCASDRGITLSATELELIERWLAAHYYVQSDQTYASKSTAGASATFQGKTSDGSIQGSKYGQAAINMDYSGCLMAISKRAFARADWLGKAPSDQIDYKDRD